MASSRRAARFLAVFAENPARIVMTAFASVIVLGTLLLMTPWASETGTPTNWLIALFTATSSTCVTGLVVVDTATHWSLFGHIVIRR